MGFFGAGEECIQPVTTDLSTLDMLKRIKLLTLIDGAKEKLGIMEDAAAEVEAAMRSETMSRLARFMSLVSLVDIILTQLRP